LPYAEIPHQFDYIMGVTGTLKTLSKSEIDNIENIHNIRKKTFIPSVFGKTDLTFILMDETGSMAGLFTQAKNTVGTIFERAQKILKDYKIDPNCFEMQFVCYRDYDCGVENILHASSWERRPENLRIN
jgi:hypothetical protein